MLFWIFEGCCFGYVALWIIGGIVYLVVKDRRAAREAAEKAKAAEEKRMLAEQKKAQNEAQRAQKQVEMEAARRPVGRPRKQTEAVHDAAQVPQKEKPEPPAALPVSVYECKTANVRAFEGQHVAFTGALPSMTRKEAIAAVTERGGRGYYKMPACTTILVVGRIKGDGVTEKLEKADEWIGQVRKITAAEFMAMLHEDAEPEMSFEQFAAAFAA